jgi:hypothetical protein
VYRPLRSETEYFLTLVRRLNSAALRDGSLGAHQELDRLHEELHHSVDRMRRLAGLTEDDLGYRYTAGQPAAGGAEVVAR